MYSILGCLSVAILGVLVSPFVLNYINKNILNSKSKSIKKVVKFLRKLHKPLGITLAVVAIVHGYLALGSIRLHTGTILYTSILITAALGGSFYRLKKKNLFKWHKRFAMISFILFLVHFFYPSAVYYLLN